MNRWRWYRRLRGGRWGRVSGYLWGHRWIHVGPECVERVDETWVCLAPGDEVVNTAQLVEGLVAGLARVRGAR